MCSVVLHIFCILSKTYNYNKSSASVTCETNLSHSHEITFDTLINENHYNFKVIVDIDRYNSVILQILQICFLLMQPQ